jgi:hypothetical protein
LQQKKELTMSNKLQLSKYEEAEIQRFSPSSFNAFRQNRITWALRYVFKKKSSYPMLGAYRGNAIERQIQQFLSNTNEKPITEYVQDAIEYYHHSIIINLFSEGMYEHTARGFSTDALGKLLRGIDKEKFPSVIESILVTHNKLNSHIELPAFTNPQDEDYGKYLRKLQKEYALIIQGVTEGIKYFAQFKGQEIKMQQRLEVMAYDLVIPTVSYSDFETPDVIYELKTVMPQKFPKEFNKIQLGHKTQAAFNSKYRKKPTKLVYVSLVSESVMDKYHKDSFIFESAKLGMSSEAIFKAYISPSGGKTTKAYVEKTITEFSSPDFKGLEKPEPIRVFDFSLQHAERFDKINRMDALAINTLFENCRKSHFEDDLKAACWGNPAEMMVDKDQKKQIEEIWGIDLDEEVLEGETDEN